MTFLPHIILFLSITGLLIILARKLPAALSSEEENILANADGPRSSRPAFFRVIGGVTHAARHVVGPKQKERAIFFIEKRLRRTRLLLMRLENRLTKFLEHFPNGSSKKVLRETFEAENKRKFTWEEVHKKIETGVPVRPAKERKLKLVFRLEEHAKRRASASKSSEEQFWLGVLRQNPRNPHPYKRLGQIYMEQGEHKEARAALAYALKRNPDDWETEKWLKDLKRET